MAEIARIRKGVSPCPAWNARLAEGGCLGQNGAADRRAARPMTRKYRFVIAACARWETRYAVEWLNYHRAIGFEHVYLYCNDDDPRALYETVLPFTQGPAPFVTFRSYPDQGQHRKMMLHFLAHDQHAAEWISFLDLDEFIRLPPGQSIAQFIAPLAPVADCVLFNWVFFGPNGHKTPPDRPVLESYTRREALMHPLTKYVARSTVFNDPQLLQKCLDNSFVHRLDEYLARPIRSVNVLGEDMAGYYADFPAGAAAFARHPPRQERLFATAMVHHYAFRSEQAFAERVARGLKGNFAGEKIWGQLAADEPRLRGFINSVNAIEDRRLADFWQALLAGAARTDVLAQQRGQLLSRGKPTSQSSYLADPEFLAKAASRGGAASGMIDGVRKFHTDFENNPWWQVDLGGFATIHEIHIYNTDDHTAARFRNFSLSVSIDGASWTEVARKEDDEVVGGIEGAPFVWAGPGAAWARFVRVTLLGRDYLHLDQVEVFGAMTHPGGAL
ncbi:discoidin domain-containing protein [Acidocella sp.]|uniref:discoidin domain-containing protein n=1 Tax=Acidocella sp. TaxID=50710 RepID=UPI00183E4E44|nr:discoidin domain-containing protein [Acidocella sp.]NNM56169.1 glycosyltransferase family 92 protein [Acidocella sp.]